MSRMGGAMLQGLERGAPVLVDRDDLSVDNRGLRVQTATGGVNPDAHTFATVKVLRGSGIETIDAERQAELLKP